MSRVALSHAYNYNSIQEPPLEYATFSYHTVGV